MIWLVIIFMDHYYVIYFNNKKVRKDIYVKSKFLDNFAVTLWSWLTYNELKISVMWLFINGLLNNDG